ncbi:MAG TPA: hypothetical protein VNK04_02405 [Gemmataceae bacterium]|nr:hypothetical protein [Gemmataceae bacterium]
MRRLLIGIMIGFGAGMVTSGIVHTFSSLGEAVLNFVILGLGTALLIGAPLAAVITRGRK